MSTSGTTYSGGTDLFVARFSSDGSDLEMGAYFGGSNEDAFETHALGLGDGHVYLAGFTKSTDLPVFSGETNSDDLPLTSTAFQAPTQNAWQPDFAGGVDQWGNGDAYVVALSPGG